VKDATKILDRVYLRSVYCRWTGDIHADRYSGTADDVLTPEYTAV